MKYQGGSIVIVLPDGISSNWIQPVTEQPTTPPSAAEEPWTVRRVLEWTTGHLKKHGSDTPRLDAEILLAHARGCQRIQLYTQFDEPLNDSVRGLMRELVQRRAKAEPGIPAPKVLDLCTGSGCIAVAVAKNAKTSLVTAADISSAAIEIARENVARHHVASQVDVIESDLFAGISRGSKYDVIASNPPYIPSAEIDQLDAEVARHEPRLALDGGADGLTILRRIIDEAPAFAASKALLLLEFTPEQADSLKAIVENHGAYDEIEVRKDLAHRPRVLKARFRG